MSLQKVPVGRNVPNDINVIIEIPMHSPAVKYEVDKESGALFLNRMLKTAMHYPCNSGYIPHTLCGDGDPTDVMVVMPVPINYGAVVTCRPVGVLNMEDESGEDAKILAVPTEDVTGLYRNVTELEHVDELLRLQIKHLVQVDQRQQLAAQTVHRGAVNVFNLLFLSRLDSHQLT